MDKLTDSYIASLLTNLALHCSHIQDVVDKQGTVLQDLDTVRCYVGEAGLDINKNYLRNNLKYLSNGVQICRMHLDRIEMFIKEVEESIPPEPKKTLKVVPMKESC